MSCDSSTRRGQEWMPSPWAFSACIFPPLQNFRYSPHRNLVTSRRSLGRGNSSFGCFLQGARQRQILALASLTGEAQVSKEARCSLQTTTRPTVCLNSTRAASRVCDVVVMVIPWLMCKDHYSMGLAGLFSSTAETPKHLGKWCFQADDSPNL